MSTAPHRDEPAAPSRRGWFDANDAPDRRELETCIHCGLCLTACPTYRELKIEPDSPRGRIYLMRGLAEGRIQPSDELVGHLDLCLDCRACETVCPAGVPYGRMLEQTRGQLERRAPRGGFVRGLGHWALRHLLPNRGLTGFAADVLRLGQTGPIGAFMRSGAAARLLPAFAVRGFAMTPPLASRRDRSIDRLAEELPQGARLEDTRDAWIVHPPAAAKLRVGFFATCVMGVMFPVTHRNAIRLLALAGAQVVIPKAQTCCGALQAHAGLRETSRALAARNVTVFGADLDRIVTHSAGCGAALRETGHLLHDRADTETARGFSERVRDVSEVLAELGLPAATSTLRSGRDASRPLRVAYHDPCHLAHAQRVRSEPRALLEQLPGIELVELPNSDWCCGSAGVYNLAQPAMAEAQLRQKLDAVVKAVPEVVVASNPGCLLHMLRGARERGLDVRLEHLVDVMALAHPPHRSRDVGR